MNGQERRRGNQKIRFNEDEIKLALDLLEKLEKTIELLYYFMKRQEKKSFVIVLLSADKTEIGLEILLKREKRNTDLLFEINKENNLYAVVCQETELDGGYRFAERLVRSIVWGEGSDIYCSELEIGTTNYPIKEVIFKLIETYMNAKQSEREGEIVFHSLH